MAFPLCFTALSVLSIFEPGGKSGPENIARLQAVIEYFMRLHAR